MKQKKEEEVNLNFIMNVDNDACCDDKYLDHIK